VQSCYNESIFFIGGHDPWEFMYGEPAAVHQN